MRKWWDEWISQPETQEWGKKIWALMEAGGVRELWHLA
jgi:hypothetical protein